MKKGFTLIELLAVIVILAIIALIATPIVLNIISDTKESANKRSIDMYAKALETAIANTYLNSTSDISGTYITEDGKILTNIETNKTIEVDYKGSDIDCDVIRVYKDGSYYLNKCKVGDKLVEDYYAGSNIPKSSIAEDIIKQYGGIDSISEIFTLKKGLYKAEDNYGTSYYLSGDIKNNYVQFAFTKVPVEVLSYKLQWDYVNMEQGMLIESGDLNTIYASEEECNNSPEIDELKTKYNEYTLYTNCYPAASRIEYKTVPIYWRLTRINGDGTIRLIYDGSELVENGVSHTATIGASMFVGIGINYMLPERNTFIAPQVEDSNIKKVLDDWYTENIEEQYGKYIADNVFCNNREVAFWGYRKLNEEYEFSIERTPEFEAAAEDADWPISPHYAGASQKILNGFFKEYKKNPSLICPNKADAHSIIETENSNGLLSKPIGLITSDEVELSGSFITSGEDFWTMTPVAFDSAGGPNLVYVTSSGNQNYLYSGNEFGVRPVINLKADVKFKGNGTIDSPYEIIMQ